MPIYLITNRVPDGFAPGPEAFAAWMAWFDSLGDAVADRGNPAFASTTAGNIGAGTTLGGYSLVTAASLDDALGLVADHPLLTRGGGVEVVGNGDALGPRPPVPEKAVLALVGVDVLLQRPRSRIRDIHARYPPRRGHQPGVQPPIGQLLG